MAPCRSDKCLKISLDTHDIVFRRKHRDGQKQVVHGEVVLCTQNPTAIKAVKVSLHGVRKVHWLTDTLQPQTVRQRDSIFFQDRLLYVFVKGTGQPSKAAPGLYTWPFSFTLPSSLPESITWLPLDTYIRYSITAEATIGSGILTKKLRVSEPLRLLKSPSFFIDELQFAPEITQQTANLTLPKSGLDATVTLSQPYQPTDNGGGVLETTFALTPLLLDQSDTNALLSNPNRIVTLSLELLQNVHLVVTDKHGEPHRGTKCTRSVATVSRSVSASELVTARETAVDETEMREGGGGGGCGDDKDSSSNGGGGGDCSSNNNSSTPTPAPANYFDLKLPLPMAPYSLVQSVHDGDKIRVRYTLQAKVSVEDEGKKTTQEEGSANLFPKLFVPVRERQDSVISSTNSVCDTDIIDECGVVTSLPSYGEHLFDTYYCWDARGLTADDILRERDPIGAVRCCGS
ncbi:putative HECT-type ubiquitin ligase-interacting protein creD [Lasiodiplodia theobromae]|uniref:Putative HECT-type ubiquitin ligase-interacting protein creD n=1 Tax=Lasiodiplodia theobromae TaxID=45133 RepID=A0A5N5DIH8_9PEZI|nr:putative HECT-type ubiquitin ligase-interacting protein creD [Lasiodiplodia theobromae]